MTLYFLTHWLFLFLPGWCLVRLLNIRRLTFLLSFALSFAWAMLTLAALIFLRAPPHWWDVLLLAVPAALLLAVLVQRAWRRRPSTRRWPGRTALVVAGLLVVWLGYLVYAGPYTEIPADVWSHVQRVQAAGGVLESGQFSGFISNWRLPVSDAGLAWSSWFKQGAFWYFLPARLGLLYGLDTATLLRGMTVANTTTWLLGHFFFALFVLRRERLRRCWKYGIAATAALLAAVTMGVNVFAYVRYYACAPAILNHVVFLAAIALWLDYLRQREWFGYELALLPVLLLVMNLVHAQEALFAVCLGFVILLVEAWRVSAGAQGGGKCRLKVGLLTAAVLGGLAVMWVLLRGRPVPSDPGPCLVPVQQLVPFLQGMLVAPPRGQFYEVITLWGVWVYVLFCLRLRAFKNHPYLLAGMLFPLFTLFNPLLVDFLLRVGVQPSELYRLAYVVPLPLAAAFLAAGALRGLCGRGRGAVPLSARGPTSMFNVRCSMFDVQSSVSISPSVPPGPTPILPYAHTPILPRCVRRCGAVLALLGLLVFMFPICTRYLEAPYSRLFTLQRLPAANDHRLWGDLLEFLRGYRGCRIITDPVTGYVVKGYTANELGVAVYMSFRHWFYSAWLRADDPVAPARLPLDPQFRWLLVINERDGGFSLNGALSGHWPGDVLSVSRYYSPALKTCVTEHPERFRLLWSSDRIRVYEVMVK